MQNTKPRTEVVLITGASSGIGEAFARTFAAAGRDLVIVARRSERLDALAQELRAKHSISVFPIVSDLSHHDGVQKVWNEVTSAELVIETVVNNAGFGMLGCVETVDLQRTLQMVDLNCRSVVELTHRVLPGMKRRRSGSIIIVSSVVGAVPAPWFATYAATKSFDLYFGEALYAECVGTGVKVVTVLPGLTKTEFQAGAGMREYHSPYRSADQVVRSALSALGKRAIVVDGWMNKILVHGTRILPRCITLFLSRSVMKVECKL